MKRISGAKIVHQFPKGEKVVEQFMFRGDLIIRTNRGSYIAKNEGMRLTVVPIHG